MTIRPLKPGESRRVERQPDGRLVARIVQSDGTEIREIPSEAEGCPADDEWPCSVFIEDHGGIGAAGSEFVENCPDDDIDYLQFSLGRISSTDPGLRKRDAP